LCIHNNITATSMTCLGLASLVLLGKVGAFYSTDYPTPSPTPILEAAQPSQDAILTYDGNLYATLDGTAYTSTASSEQLAYSTLPDNWNLAPDEPKIVSEVIAKYPWGADKMVTSTGSTYLTSSSTSTSSPPGTRYDTSGLITSDDGYMIRYSYSRILIVKKKGGTSAGAVVGGIFAVFLVACLVYYFYRLHHSDDANMRDDDLGKSLLQNDHQGIPMVPPSTRRGNADIRTGNVGKYAVGQKINGLAGGTVSGIVTAIHADTPGASDGPGVLSIDMDQLIQTSKSTPVGSIPAARGASGLKNGAGGGSQLQRLVTPNFAPTEPGVPIQTYRVRLGFQLSLRAQPDHGSMPTGFVLTQGSAFEVDTTQIAKGVRKDGGDQTFLRTTNLQRGSTQLIEGPGAAASASAESWTFQYHPVDGNEVCELTWNTKIKELDYTELQQATNNFEPSCEIGDGACSSVYRAELRGVPCALKVFSADANTWEAKQFTCEMDLLSRVIHPNICRLYASSTEGLQKCLGEVHCTINRLYY
jgi:hypothetical protein